MVNIFDNQRFVTRGAADHIPPDIQELMWQLVEKIKTPKDYLQVFTLSHDFGMQKIIHSQEEPEYKATLWVKTDDPVTCKVFVIDDGDHSTMLLSSEY